MKSSRKTMSPIHPGEILSEEFLQPLGITQYRLAKTIGVPQRRIGEIIQGNRGITADTALRLARAFKTTPQFWMNLQTRYDLECRGDGGIGLRGGLKNRWSNDHVGSSPTRLTFVTAKPAKGAKKLFSLCVLSGLCGKFFRVK